MEIHRRKTEKAGDLAPGDLAPGDLAPGDVCLIADCLCLRTDETDDGILFVSLEDGTILRRTPQRSVIRAKAYVTVE